ncbi:MAG: transporter permease, partial [Devosia sp.]|uniref:ABC transporter permease n=1 Tax=Devosia sp. TaxID=1871048 RepID=UPI002603E4C3
LGLLVAVFFLTRMTGDPAGLYLPDTATLEMKQAYALAHGYSDPLAVQFWNYVLGLLRLDFGVSMRQQQSAMLTVFEAVPTTLTLTAIALTVSLTVTVLIGALAASRPGGIFDRLATTISLIGASAPDFWVALVGVLVFAVTLHWLPTSGTGGPQYWVMPVFVVCLRPLGLVTQVVRGTMISVLSEPYIKTAKAKGLGRGAILAQALRSSLLPVITVGGDIAVGMINGSLIAETVFGLHGVGKVLIDAITNRDFAVVQSAVLVVAIAIFVLNILIDVLYALVDPRIRYN